MAVENNGVRVYLDIENRAILSKVPPYSTVIAVA
jgi:hypothetical protein